LVCDDDEGQVIDKFALTPHITRNSHAFDVRMRGEHVSAGLFK
jgi:hypothetical protein